MPFSAVTTNSTTVRNCSPACLSASTASRYLRRCISATSVAGMPTGCVSFDALALPVDRADRRHAGQIPVLVEPRRRLAPRFVERIGILAQVLPLGFRHERPPRRQPLDRRVLAVMGPHRVLAMMLAGAREPLRRRRPAAFSSPTAGGRSFLRALRTGAITASCEAASACLSACRRSMRVATSSTDRLGRSGFAGTSVTASGATRGRSAGSSSLSSGGHSDGAHVHGRRFRQAREHAHRLLGVAVVPQPCTPPLRSGLDFVPHHNRPSLMYRQSASLMRLPPAPTLPEEGASSGGPVASVPSLRGGQGAGTTSPAVRFLVVKVLPFGMRFTTVAA